jgi:hypothetical protein
MKNDELINNIKRDFSNSLKLNYDPENLSTFCLILGPYRNLTTLLSAIVSLHPNAQVLNHAYDRVVNIQNLNIFTNYDKEKFKTLINYIIEISAEGTRGSYGGSILHSHAYANHPQMRETYQERYGENKVKDEIKSIVWKESLSVTRYIKSPQTDDIRNLLEQCPQLRLLLPIRNPIDCAISNLQTGTMAQVLTGSEKPTFEMCLKTILSEVEWFDKLMIEFPDQMMMFSQNQFNPKGINSLASFLEIDCTDAWQQDVKKAVDLKPSYQVEQPVKDYYISSIKALDISPSTLETLNSFL